ncbi:MAG: nitrogen fixation protein NifZ [Aliarcobacter sp.]|nr:nitrogen fixation protein NifZ [Aliarcobacter sp.]
MAVHLVELVQQQELKEEAVGVNHKEIVDVNTILHDSVTASRSGRDEDEPKFGIGQKVKLLEDIKNDGTYPHAPIGTIMVQAGAIGYIKSIGEFLQVIRVYEVHFLDLNALIEVVGCREHELLAMEDYRDEVREELEFMRLHREKNYSK